MNAQISGKILLLAKRLTKLGFYLCCLCLLSTLLFQSRVPTELEKLLARGEIVMLSRNGPTTYYEAIDGYTGFEFELGQAFADYLGLKLVLEEEGDLSVMISGLNHGAGDFAAATLSVTKPRKYLVDFGPEYGKVSQRVIYRAGTTKPRSVEDLIDGQIVVIEGSSHEQNLTVLKREYPDLSWEVSRDAEMIDLLEAVHSGEIQYTIVDSVAHEMSKALYPRARKAFTISEEQGLAWAFPKMRDKTVLKHAEKFFSLASTQDLIKENTERFYGHAGKLDFGGSVLFTKRLRSRLPKWQDKLVEAGDLTKLDWRLLAAISYQESHWNPKAVSPTGVKGFMMLTQAAAKDVGVNNRLDANQSIVGGAKYFRKMYERIPERIEDPDRLWFALAAYNIGLGHLEDARILANHYGADSDKWVDVKEYVLLLAKRKYYKFTRHGYARGWEAVDYVENIRTFYNIIDWYERDQQQLALSEEAPNFEEFNPVVMETLRALSQPSASTEL